jgi:hypothetical protein
MQRWSNVGDDINAWQPEKALAQLIRASSSRDCAASTGVAAKHAVFVDPTNSGWGREEEDSQDTLVWQEPLRALLDPGVGMAWRKAVAAYQLCQWLRGPSRSEVLPLGEDGIAIADAHMCIGHPRALRLLQLSDLAQATLGHAQAIACTSNISPLLALRACGDLILFQPPHCLHACHLLANILPTAVHWLSERPPLFISAAAPAPAVAGSPTAAVASVLHALRALNKAATGGQSRGSIGSSACNRSIAGMLKASAVMEREWPEAASLAALHCLAELLRCSVQHVQEKGGDSIADISSSDQSSNAAISTADKGCASFAATTVSLALEAGMPQVGTYSRSD